MKKIILAYLSLLFTLVAWGNSKDSLYRETKISIETKTGKINGTLCTPKKSRKSPVALIIAGSGPTDRNGNSIFTKNDGYKILAHQLAEKKIATVRFDKRGVGESIEAFKGEASLRFEDYVEDVKTWLQLLKTDKRFSSVTIIGHSEGSLIGMLAASNADKYISVAGAGTDAVVTLRTQLSSQPKQIRDMAMPILDSLAVGRTVEKVDPMLFAVFRPSVQPYMISWFKYNPQAVIGNLKIPLLIIQGTNDLQISVGDAKLLSAANPKSKLVLIENMNHIFRKVKNKDENLASYKDPSIPIAGELVTEIAGFIKNR